MKVKIETDIPIEPAVKVGYVYQVRGGYGAKYGHMMVVVGVFEGDICGRFNRMTSCLIVNKEGDIVGATNYGSHYFEEKTPIAFVEGLEELELVMRSI